MVCHLLINGLLAHPKCVESRDLSYDRTRDESGDLLLIWSHETQSPDRLARAPCFSGSHAGLITGFTCGTFDLELVVFDVADCVHDSQSRSNQSSPCNVAAHAGPAQLLNNPLKLNDIKHATHSSTPIDQAWEALSHMIEGAP
jgi:hypothetical protein